MSGKRSETRVVIKQRRKMEACNAFAASLCQGSVYCIRAIVCNSAGEGTGGGSPLKTMRSGNELTLKF